MELLAAAASCPTEDCGAISLTYHLAEIAGPRSDDLWEFTCPRCGLEFLTPGDDLLFQSIREEWLRAGIHSA